jgi:phage terminase large subunit
MNAEFPEKLEFLFEPHRYKIGWGGRGSAKSWSFARALLIQGATRRLRILCARETQKSLKDSVHTLLRDQVELLGFRHRYHVGEAVIEGNNGTEIIFAGLKHNVNNIKSVEACDIVWVEEAQSVSDASWEVLIPTIRKNGSEIWASLNPLLETDATYKRFILNPPPNAKVVKIGWQDNPWFPDVLRIEMEHLRDTDPKAYQHVWEGACKSAVDGAIYGEELKKAEAEGRITTVSCDRTKPVQTFLGSGLRRFDGDLARTGDERRALPPDRLPREQGENDRVVPDPAAAKGLPLRNRLDSVGRPEAAAAGIRPRSRGTDARRRPQRPHGDDARRERGHQRRPNDFLPVPL